MALGQRIRAGWKRLGLSRGDLGGALGVTRRTISKWEAGGAMPEMDKLIALDRLFCFPVEVLLEVEETAVVEPSRPIPR